MNLPPPKKVIFFTNTLLPISQTFIKEQALNLRSWQPILVGEKYDNNGLTLDEFERLFLLSPNYSHIEKFIYRLCRWFSIASPFTLKRLKSLNADLIHAHFATSATDIWPYAKALGLPLVVTLHGYDITINASWWEEGNDTLRMKSYPQKLTSLIKAKEISFIAVSCAIKEYAISRGIPANRIRVCYTGLDIEKFRPSRKNTCPQIIFVGRLVEKKGPSILINAFSIVKKMMPSTELIIVGDGPLRQECEELSRNLELEIIFTGALKSNDIIKLIQGASVLCLPSIKANNGDDEGFGMVILEAQACGTPVISSATGGAEEGIIDGITGFKFSAGKIDELAEKLIEILNDKNALSIMSKAARTYIEINFDIKKRIVDIEKVYTEAISGCQHENIK